MKRTISPEPRRISVHDCLQPLFELAAELAAGDHAAHVQGDDALVLEVVRHVAGDDLRASPSTIAVLPTPVSPMSTGLFLVRRLRICMSAPDLVLAADDGVELALSRHLREVDAVLFEGAVAALCRRAVDAGAAADLLDRLIEAFLVDAELAQDVRRLAVLVVGDGGKDVLYADVVILEAVGLGVCRLQQADDPGVV